MRIDKWLWAARFFKTRSQAADAVDGGKVKISGVTVKPAKEVKPGNLLTIRTGTEEWEVVVTGLNEQRRPASEARLLYQETPESEERRARMAELRQLAPVQDIDTKGRPTKRDRRQMNRFRGEE